MSIAIPATTQAPPPSQTASEANPAAPPQKPAPPQALSKSSAAADSVKITTAAQTLLPEVPETQTQTIREATHGDQRAVRLLAKEAAARKS